MLQQWRGQLRDLHKNWLARLWQDFAQGKLLAELPLDRWTVAQTEESLPSLLPATGVFSGWVFRRKGQQSFNKSPRFPFSPPAKDHRLCVAACASDRQPADQGHDPVQGQRDAAAAESRLS